MELFEQIRREYEFGVGTIAGVSRKLGVHRRMVREALHSAEPAAVKAQQRRLRKLNGASDFIDPPTVEAIDLGHLARYERPMPVISGYDQLLSTRLSEVQA